MTPWLRTLPTVGLLAAALLCGTGPTASAAQPPAGALAHGGAPGRAAPAVPGPGRAIPTPDDSSRAGSLAGEGRARPGRADEDDPDPEETDPGTDLGTDISDGLTQVGVAPEAPREDTAPVQQSVVNPGSGTSGTKPVLQLLPLGGGLILVGLGLGLAFVGLRVRRG
ncbi:hypothetical protein AB0912_01785 [Streptomyces sp. NPDC007084]|uniref:hypothetical protein n=1 Tax=Streptomyces sp. NPDC007084 TaxID=3154313 RepID=UPI00345379F1